VLVLGLHPVQDPAAPGRGGARCPYYGPLAELDRERAQLDFDRHIWLAVAIARHAVGRVRSGGTLPTGRVVGPADVATPYSLQ
jgi:hypothetical protein